MSKDFNKDFMAVKKKCERCGDEFWGGVTGKYCVTCKDIIMTERKRNYMINKRKNK